jgi:hypothetical protein
MVSVETHFFQAENQVADSISHSLIEYTFLNLKERCVPLLNDVNYCGLYKSEITVFGHNLRNDDALTHIMKKALKSVGNTRINAAPLGVMRLVPSEKHTRIVGDDFNFYHGGGVTRSGNSLTPGAKAGFIFSALTLIGGILFLVFYLHVDLRSRGVTKAGYQRSERKRGFSSLLRCFFSNKPHDDDQIAFVESIYMEEFADHRRTGLVKLGKGDCSVTESSILEEKLKIGWT